MCYGCGFTTNTLMEPNSEFLNEQLEVLPEIYKDLSKVESDDKPKEAFSEEDEKKVKERLRSLGYLD